MRTARTRIPGTAGVVRIAVLFTLAIGLCGVNPVWSQEKEVPKAELLVGYSYFHSSDTNFNGWKTSLTGNVNHWLGIAADFDGHYASSPWCKELIFGTASGVFGFVVPRRSSRGTLRFGFCKANSELPDA